MRHQRSKERLSRARQARGRTSLALGLVLVAACGGDPSPFDAGVAPEDAGASDAGHTDAEPLPPRPAVQTCRFEGTVPGQLPHLEAQPAPFVADDPVDVAVDARGRTWIAERSGRILRVDGSTKTQALALADLGTETVEAIGIAVGNAGGIAGGRDALFVQYLSTTLRVSRFALAPDGRVVGEELRLLDLTDPGRDHHGGGLYLDAQGQLFVMLGDGGGAGDPRANAQNLDTLPGSILRLDVSSSTTGAPYEISSDNPFVSTVGARDEIWAYGLQDPRDCTEDDDGVLWCVDRSDAGQQEINVVFAGNNFGWPGVEGRLCRAEGGACDAGDFRAPVATYALGPGDCGIVGGLVEPSLGSDGAYVFFDRCSGRIFGVPRPLAFFAEAERLGTVPGGVSSVARQADGSLLVSSPSGAFFHLDIAAVSSQTFPERLSASGCFTDMTKQTPGPDLVPFRVASPLWTDGALKRRWMVVPPGEIVTPETTGAWTFPNGSILIKEFAYEIDGQRKPVETRVMVREEDAWSFHTYQWTATATEARLLDRSRVETLTVDIGAGPTEVEYLFPSRFHCGICHGPATTIALGPTNAQLDHDGQLEAMAAIGLIPSPQREPSRLVDPADTSASLEARARSYLHTNCAHCHQPGGWVPANMNMDLRIERSFVDTETCGVERTGFSPREAGLLRIDPGHPENSTIVGRMSRRDLFQMPLFATSVVDPTGVEIVSQWISSLETCP